MVLGSGGPAAGAKPSDNKSHACPGSYTKGMPEFQEVNTELRSTKQLRTPSQSDRKHRAPKPRPAKRPQESEGRFVQLATATQNSDLPGDCELPSLQFPGPSVQFPVSSSQCPVPSLQCPVSSAQCPVSSSQSPVPSVLFPACSFQRKSKKHQKALEICVKVKT